MTIIDIEQGSEAWYKIKAGKITGTRFSKAMAADSTATFKDLVTDLAGEIITGELEESYTNAIMERGLALEPEARAVYESEIAKVTEAGFCMLDGYEDSVGISPDGLLEDGTLEIKCPIRKTHLNYIEKDTLPSVYKWQVQGGLMVTDGAYCDFMSYYPGMKPFIYRVIADKEMHAQLMIEIDKVIALVKLKVDAYNNYQFNEEITL